MSLFRSEEDVATYVAEMNLERGDVVPLETVWRLAQLWYGNRMDPAYHGRSRDEAIAIFRAVGLTSEFWTA